MFLWGWDVGFVRGTERDTGFQLFGDKLIDQRKNCKLAAYSCVRFQVKSSNASVSCQVLSNVSTIARQRNYREIVVGGREPLPGAFIFHTDPLSQPCSVSFCF